MALDRGLTRAFRRPVAVAAAGLSLVASGCWPQPGAGPRHSRDNGAESALEQRDRCRARRRLRAGHVASLRAARPRDAGSRTGAGAATYSPLATVPITGFATDLSVSGGRVFAATTLGNGDDYALSALALA